MQFSDEFIAVSSVGMSRMDYLALPVAIHADSDTAAPETAVGDAWNAIQELLFDDDAKAFVEIAKKLACRFRMKITLATRSKATTEKWLLL